MIARAFTNVYKYFFSLPAYTSSLYVSQACTCIEQAPPLSNFKRAANSEGAAKAAPAPANFVGCQILKAAAI